MWIASEESRGKLRYTRFYRRPKERGEKRRIGVAELREVVRRNETHPSEQRDKMGGETDAKPTL